MQANKDQLSAIHAILAKLPGDPKELKKALVLEFSGGRATSSKDLTKDEATALIRRLKDEETKTPSGRRTEKMKKKIIAMAMEMGWKNDGHIDMKHLDNWCLTLGIYKKKLDQHNAEELPSLVTQFELGPYRYYLQKF